MHARVAGQRRERIQRREHLRGRAFEQAAAAAREQRVAAKHVRDGGAVAAAWKYAMWPRV
jgi:hypothetical protein